MSSVSPSSGGSSQISYTQTELFKALPAADRAKLISSLTEQQLNTLFFSGESIVPPLVSPSNNVGMNDFFRTISESITNLRQQLSRSEYIDQQTRRKPNQAATIVAQALSGSLAAKETSKQQAYDDTTTAVTNLQKQMTQMTYDTTDQNQAILDVDNGSGEEISQSQQQTESYTNFINQITEDPINAELNADGTYTIPSGPDEDTENQRIAAYNDAVAEYNAQVDTFNSFWQSRSQLLQNYNTQTDSYNEQANNNNYQIHVMIDVYGLSDYVTSHGLSLDQMQADYVNEDHLFETLSYADTITTLPSAILSGEPPSWVDKKANGEDSNIIANISYTGASVDPEQFRSTIYDKVYTEQVAGYDTDIAGQLLLWSYLNSLNIFNPPQQTAPDPLLNTKVLLLKLLPKAFIQPTQPVGTSGSQGTNSLATEAIGLGSGHIEALLAKSLLQQALGFSSLDRNQQMQAVTALMLLILSLIGQNALHGLFPSLQPLSQLLGSLPNNSPAFALLFATSFGNRTLESIQQGLNQESLTALLSGLPGMANLNATEQANLQGLLLPILNVSQLLIATKLLGATLGLPQLINQLITSLILPQVAPELAASLTPLFQQGETENKQDLASFKETLQTTFKEQGYSEEVATFLAEFETAAIEQGLFLAPNAPQISKDSVQIDTLKQSLTAGLVLAGYDLPQSQTISNQTVEATLGQNNRPYSSNQQFYATVQDELRHLGVKTNLVELIAQIIVVPKQTPASAELASKTPLSEDALSKIVVEQVSRLLTPQLGEKLSKTITAELALTLFGTPTPDSRQIADVKSPVSLVNTLKDQLLLIKNKQQAKNFETVAALFAETMKTSVDPEVFLAKLMDIANAFLYSAGTGIMYSGHKPSNWKESIDIPV